MKQVMVKRGQILVEEMPAPSLEPDTLLIQVDYSCISAGTETSQLHATKAPLWKRALEKPEKAKEFIRKAFREGISNVIDEVDRKLNAAKPTGYSIAGTVLEVGSGITEFKKGDRVAAAGSQFAHHAEVVRVPKNLCLLVPAEVSIADASTVTLGAIALQGVRRANPTLGETFVVLGLGILGQLTSQILKANGCKVIGIDLDGSRLNLAKELGADEIIQTPNDEVESVYRMTDGIGADGVIITAASSSDAIIQSAFEMCRRKGRVILVGDVGLDLKRDELYAKELDFLISTSYGPGRYDPRYEEQGLDYPIGFVRWTENRNMKAYLDLIASKNISLSRLISKTYPVEKSVEAFASLENSESRPMILLLSYPHQEPLSRKVLIGSTVASTKKKTLPISVAVIGAGNFAKDQHLPNLSKQKNLFKLHSVVTRTGFTAKEAAKTFKADFASTDFHSTVTDPNVDAVIISTRHQTHSSMALESLKAGKHCLVEKPLSLNTNELNSIAQFYEENPSAPILLTGFNRRFSPYMKKLKEWMGSSKNPVMIHYTMNAGYIPLDHWVHSAEGGGRNIGEACHIYDLFVYLTNSLATKISVTPLQPNSLHYSAKDNFSTTIQFENGSVAELTYTALGAKNYSKERMEVFFDGKVGILNDYSSVELFEKSGQKKFSGKVDKGQREELTSFARSIESGIWASPLWQQVEATRISFEVENQLNTRS